jgi:hypothetical protein
MDNVVVEEQNPLPLPVEKQHNNAYMNEKFKNRHKGEKNRLLIEGKVRVANTNGKPGVAIMMPSE